MDSSTVEVDDIVAAVGLILHELGFIVVEHKKENLDPAQY